MATDQKHYRYFLTEKERMIIDHVRKTEIEFPQPSIPDTHRTRSKDVSIELHVTDGCLGRCVVESTDLIHGFLSAGAAFKPSFLEWQHSEDQSDIGYISARDEDDQASQSNHETTPTNNEYVENEDYLPQLGDDETPVQGPETGSPTESSAKEPADKCDKKESLEWSTVLKELIPPEVKHITFTIDNESKELPLEELRTRFPNVQFIIGGLFQRQSRYEKFLSSPRGIKGMQIVLDEIALAVDPTLKSEIESVFPWASIMTGGHPKSFEDENITADGPTLLENISHPPSSHSVKHDKATVSPLLKPVGDGVVTEAVLFDTAQRISLELEPPIREALSTMLKQLSETGEVQGFNTSNKIDEILFTAEIEAFYDSLVRFYILCHGSGAESWAERVLYRFSETNMRYLDDFPTFKTLETAFRYLPHSNALCETIGTLFAFVWGTEDDGCCTEFTKTHGVELDAMGRFLYKVAYHRDDFTRGLDAEVHRRWCNHHTHKEGDANYKICEKYKYSLRFKRAKAEQKEKKQKYDEAMDVINNSGFDAVILPGMSSDAYCDSENDGGSDFDIDAKINVPIEVGRKRRGKSLRSEKGGPQKPAAPQKKKRGRPPGSGKKARATPTLSGKKPRATPAASPQKKARDVSESSSKKRKSTDTPRLSPSKKQKASTEEGRLSIN
ncbi:hypothetical protein IQ07DRAFT_683913 [Pyrenochaeta sp. DS3sAY3a]|nr:hypothetical protein IQ07DRAFT_683913 [Pyrenochaeta sp. DS3sAY3a]